MKLFKALFLSAIIWAASSPHAKAQMRSPVSNQGKSSSSSASTRNETQEVGENDVVKVTTSLVRVPVSVKDRDGRYVADLKREEFQVYENGSEQKIVYFGGVEEPLSVVLLIDASCSIEKPEDTKAAALAFIDQLRPADSVLPIAFGRNIYALLTESTTDHALLRERILLLPDGKQTPCDGATRLYDAVDFVIQHVLKQGSGRRAVILLTDGTDSNISRPGSFMSTLRDASELGVPFYSVRLLNKWRGPDNRFRGFPNDNPVERAKNNFFWRDIDKYIDDLASLSGGRSFPMTQGGQLKDYFIQIGEELRHQYLLAYYPDTSKGEQQRRKIRVRVNRQKVNVRARESYLYIPSGK